MKQTTSIFKEEPKPMTPQALADMMSELKQFPRPEWLLISPDGTLHKGTADQLLPIMSEHLSFMKRDGT